MDRFDRYDLRKNKEGYADPTAYKAITNADSCLDDCKTGEIWEITTKSKNYEAIIVKDHGNVCTILQLQDSKSFDSDVAVNCNGIKYSAVNKISYCFPDSCAGFLRKLTDDELMEIKDTIANKLGIESIATVEEIIQPEEPKKDYFNEYNKVKTELDVYKNLYDNLLQKVIGE